MGFKTKILITIDTEVLPCSPDLGKGELNKNIQRDIFGSTKNGEFGIRYQMSVLNRFGLRGVFFVDPFFARVTGYEKLKEIVELIQNNGHEIQAHLHTDWLKRMRHNNPLLDKVGYNIKEFNVEEQSVLLRAALKDLTEAGAKKICAFRAGNWGYNDDTLIALSHVGIKFDTSHNRAVRWREIPFTNCLNQLSIHHGVVEFPVTCYEDLPFHYRPAQITACSFLEIRKVLKRAWLNKMPYFVIVTHSMELIKSRRKPFSADFVVIRRFESLCNFLAKNREKFETIFFSDVNFKCTDTIYPKIKLRSHISLTGLRYIEQFIRRLT